MGDDEGGYTNHCDDEDGVVAPYRPKGGYTNHCDDEGGVATPYRRQRASIISPQKWRYCVLRWGHG